ncbi:tR-dihydrouridine synthase [Daphnia sinensis]|uniref:tRNA-dihydrouridine(47) synthase [NAD(P)(+)] n=1 Tax=Daphnia sinensis TaxID=1820382 RepID=A0AAD5PNZ5_9CRUS|nr:tR-dihydrouridine synthase [Daphnia sinensis]
MREAAAIAEEAGPDILDINYGCPVHKVACKGAGAGILLDIPKMVVHDCRNRQTCQYPRDSQNATGLESRHDSHRRGSERLQRHGIQAISIHARTRQQMYKGEADWSYLNLVKENPRLHIPVFGNGDIDSPEKAQEYRTKYNVDGMMIGRASIGYPWIFNEIKHYFATGEKLPTPDLDERLAVTKKHLDFSVEWKGEKQGILEMRRHYTSYFRGMPNFKTFRTEWSLRILMLKYVKSSTKSPKYMQVMSFDITRPQGIKG